MISPSAPPFELRPLAEKAAYRMVRVSFESALHYRECCAVSDVEVIRAKDFDWSLLPVKREGEKIFEVQRRRAELWMQTGICPNPRMYEVLGSHWIAELDFPNPLPWHHYILLGHDEYMEVIARAWSWEPGQAIWEKAVAGI